MAHPRAEVLESLYFLVHYQSYDLFVDHPYAEKNVAGDHPLVSEIYDGGDLVHDFDLDFYPEFCLDVNDPDCAISIDVCD